MEHQPVWLQPARVYFGLLARATGDASNELKDNGAIVAEARSVGPTIFQVLLEALGLNIFACGYAR